MLGEGPEARGQHAKIDAVTAGEAMTSPAVMIEADGSIGEAATTMIERAVDSFPVTSAGVLVGIVTRSDLVRVYTRSDEHVEDSIRQDVIRRILLLEPLLFDVTVTHGVAVIRGRVERQSVAELVGPAIAMHPAVISVDADISWELDDCEPELSLPSLHSGF